MVCAVLSPKRTVVSVPVAEELEELEEECELELLELEELEDDSEE